MGGADLPAHLDAVAVRQADVEDRDVGLGRRDASERLGGARLADDLDVVLGLEQLADAPSDDLVVVEQEDTKLGLGIPRPESFEPQTWSSRRLRRARASPCVSLRGGQQQRDVGMFEQVAGTRWCSMSTSACLTICALRTAIASEGEVGSDCVGESRSSPRIELQHL